MKITVMSDLHFDFHDYKEWFKNKEIAGEVLILAGDIVELWRAELAVAIFKEFCARFKHVLYVPGNHEYYGSSPSLARNALKVHAKDLPNFHVLESGKPVTLDGQRFIGDTMWFPDTPINRPLEGTWSDFHEIVGLRPFAYHENEKFLEFISTELKSDDVVVTHHAPSFASVSPKYKGNIYNCFFISDVSRVIEEKQPKLWVHGHVHTPFDYKIGETRVFCNPFGYPREYSKDWFFKRMHIQLENK